MNVVSERLHKIGAISTWRSELYSAKLSWDCPPCFLVERGCCTFFGISQFGTHLNGFVRDPHDPDRIKSMWLGKRSRTKFPSPGLYDNLVGGGLPYGVTPTENILKESKEEANLPIDLQTKIKSVGAISYVNDESSGLKYNTMFVYDLECPPTFVPENLDGEVETFELWSIQDLLVLLLEAPSLFKGDICLVLVDFFIRHGILVPELKYIERGSINENPNEISAI